MILEFKMPHIGRLNRPICGNKIGPLFYNIGFLNLSRNAMSQILLAYYLILIDNKVIRSKKWYSFSTKVSILDFR
jgi:hypothetical protein